MLFQGGQEPLVLEVPQRLVPGPCGQKGEIGNELAEADVRRQLADAFQQAENFFSSRVDQVRWKLGAC